MARFEKKKKKKKTHGDIKSEGGKDGVVSIKRGSDAAKDEKKVGRKKKGRRRTVGGRRKVRNGKTEEKDEVEKKHTCIVSIENFMF
jgi:hypothetical protein